MDVMEDGKLMKQTGVDSGQKLDWCEMRVTERQRCWRWARNRTGGR